jgi:hypothetical protein
MLTEGSSEGPKVDKDNILYLIQQDNISLTHYWNCGAGKHSTLKRYWIRCIRSYLGICLYLLN